MKRTNQNNIKNMLELIGNNIKEETEKIINSGAERILSDAKARINDKTGKLSASGHIEEMKSKSKYRVMIVFDAKADDEYEYSKMVEFRPGHEHPFLYPAYDANIDSIREEILEAIKKATEKR